MTLFDQELALALTGLNEVEELEELLARCYASTELFCRTFFPHVFTRSFSPAIHGPIFRLLDGGERRVAIAAPRGVGKSSILTLAYPAKRILFMDTNYIVMIGATADIATDHADDLKDELVTNELIRAIWGPLEPETRTDPFGQKEWVTRTGVMVKPRGAGQQVRGGKYRSNRPNLILVDDLENDEAVESEDLRDKLSRWLFSAVMNSVDLGGEWRIIVDGTILHEDSLLNNLLNHGDWVSVRLEICDDQYRSNWPEYQNDEQIRAMAQSYREKSMLDVFYREQRNIPIALEDQGFKPEYFRYYDLSEKEINENSDYEGVVLMDPARTMKTGNAFTAIVGLSVNVVNGEILIREIDEGHYSPQELYDRTFEMAQRINALVIAPEVTGLNEYITYPLNNEMTMRGVHYIMVEVKPREGKTGPKRSAGLIPMYRQGLIWHNKDCCGVLERYLLQWPRPQKWDVIDAVSGIIYVLEEGERYFVRDSADDKWEQEDLEPALVMETVI